MKTIQIADVTIREHAGGSGYTLSFKEKIEVARQLDKLHVDVIEMPALTDSPADAVLLRAVCQTVNNSVLSFQAGMDEAHANKVWQIAKLAKKPRMHVSVPVSPVQMEYIAHKKGPKILELIEAQVKVCAGLCRDVEFTAGDAARAEREFVAQAVETAIRAGATTITLCDTAGLMLPDELSAFIADMYARVETLKDVTLSIQCANELGMATACAFAAIKAGAGQMKTAIGSQNASSLEEVAHLMRLRADSCGVSCNLVDTALKRAIRQMSWLDDVQRSGKTAFDGGVGGGMAEAGEALEAGADIQQVSEAVKGLGYDLSEDDTAKVFEDFKRVARKKTAVSMRELEAIIASTALQVPPTYELISYVINSGNVISATANITLEKQKATLQGLSSGDGPIDAAFLAIEQVIGHHYELDDFQIQSVTEGREAMGDALVKLRSNGKLFSGKGISTDIIGASIRAYLNALNKIVYEESAV